MDFASMLALPLLIKAYASNLHSPGCLKAYFAFIKILLMIYHYARDIA
jgi:hypothetical protein